MGRGPKLIRCRLLGHKFVRKQKNFYGGTSRTITLNCVRCGVKQRD